MRYILDTSILIQALTIDKHTSHVKALFRNLSDADYTANSTAVQRFHIEGQLAAPDVLPNFALDLADVWV